MFTTLYINFSDAQGQITLELVVVSGRNLDSIKLSCMSSLPARIKDDSIKNEGARLVTTFLPLQVYGDFSRSSRQLTPVLDLTWPNFELIRDVTDILVTCKNKEDSIKNEGARSSQHFLHYNSMGAICCHENKSSDPMGQKPNAPFPHPGDASDIFFYYYYSCLTSRETIFQSC